METTAVLERCILITCRPGAEDRAGALLEVLDLAQLYRARREALGVLERRSTRRTRDVLRALDAIDEALERSDV